MTNLLHNIVCSVTLDKVKILYVYLCLNYVNISLNFISMLAFDL